MCIKHVSGWWEMGGPQGLDDRPILFTSDLTD